MAKRRRLEAPSTEELTRMEAEFEEQAKARAGAAPIAQVAGEAAASLQLADPATRAENARNKADAEKLHEAREKGLVLLDLPLDEIEADAMIRDRSVLDAEAMAELERSILASGLRLPIEVFELNRAEGPRYGLLSGYRRLRAMQAIRAKTGPGGGHETIRAILRQPHEDGDRFAAMVEENEVREALSHFERGRIAVIAAQQGAFPNAEAAVNALFPVASKAKRSKIRSFASIFEELGDLLQFPELLREKDGLRIANALRAGGERRLREVLEAGQAVDFDTEWALIDAALKEFDDKPKVAARGGRPKTRPVPSGWLDDSTLKVSNGVTMKKGVDSQGYYVRFSGRPVSPEMIDDVMEEIRRNMERRIAG